VGNRLRQLAALGLGGFCLWVAAPALSTTPYLPPAVDFEQPLGPVDPTGTAKRLQGDRPGEGPVTHRSAVVTAPQRFDAVGLAGERRPLELRARLEGAEWTEWIEVANGDPLFVVGGAEEVQVRARGWRPAGPLHYVNVSGTTSRVQGALTGARQAISSALVSAVDLVSAPAQAAVRKPDFVSREAWGAEREEGGCHPRAEPAYGKVRAAAVHHTVTSNSYPRSQSKAIVLAICRYHRNANGWNDIGYQALVDRFGRLFAGRAGGLGRAVVGAQAQGYNAETAGIAAIGDHSSAKVSGPAFRGLRNYLAWKLDLHGHGARGHATLTSAGGDVNRHPAGERVRVQRIFRHGKVDYTACPGRGLAGQLERLRRATGKRIQAQR
jgi:N-acetylmuramoyl-L-alanine amidase